MVKIAWVHVQGHGVGLVVRGISLAGGMTIKVSRLGWISSVRVNQVVILMGSHSPGLSCGTPLAGGSSLSLAYKARAAAWDSAKAPLPWAEQTQGPQRLLTHLALQTLQHLRSPPLEAPC